MQATDYVLYGIWLLFPLFYFGLALYAKLERISGTTHRSDIKDNVRQGFFVLICVVIAYFADRSALQYIATNVFMDMLPLGFFRVMIFPVILYLMAMIVGPSKEIKITKTRTNLGDLSKRKK